MTQEAAIFGFLSGFGIPAYAATAVPSDVEFPYITYSPVISGWNQGEATMVVNVWYRTESEAEPNAKVREIGEVIGIGGVTIPCDDGILWLKRGLPWAQSLSDESDSKVKRRYLNVDMEYLVI